jgi:hypothetical protein
MSDSIQTIEELQERYSVLDHKRSTNQALLSKHESDLKKLKKQALNEFETDDLEELKTKLAALKEENARKQRDYQKLLEEVEGKLEAVEADHSTANDEA